jgi:hypothetical protein
MTEPISISWSALRTHTECKQKSHLMRGHKRSPAKDIRSYFHGVVVDRIMRAWLNNPNRAPGAMAAQVDTTIAESIDTARTGGDGIVRWRNADDRAHLRRFCTDLVTRLEPILTDLVLPHPFEAAKRFKAPVRMPYLDGTPTTINLIGEMDLLVREPGYVVWDLKGTADNTYWRKVLGQLIFYDLAVLALHGEPTVRCGLIQPMCDEPVLTFDITPELRRQMWGRIAGMATDIWRADTSCKDGTTGCNYCEVNHACPRYRPTGNTMTLGMALRQSTLPA